MSQLEKLDNETARFYVGAMSALQSAGVPFLVGGAYAYARYTEIERETKDLDLFIKAKDLDAALEALHDVGYETGITHPHWLAKTFEGDASIDLIFASGNGLCIVDETWFERARPQDILGLDALLCPPEETIWMKSFIMERERFDGADVAHLLRDCASRLDWEHLLSLFGPHWRVLYGHLILFGFIYPSRRHLIPDVVMQECTRGVLEEQEDRFDEPLCRGTLLSRKQYLTDVNELGYKDARKWPVGSMTGGEIDEWTKAIDEEE